MISYALYGKRIDEDEGWSLLYQGRSNRFEVRSIGDEDLEPGEQLVFYVGVETANLSLQGDRDVFERTKSKLSSGLVHVSTLGVVPDAPEVPNVVFVSHCAIGLAWDMTSSQDITFTLFGKKDGRGAFTELYHGCNSGFLVESMGTTEEDQEAMLIPETAYLFKLLCKNKFGNSPFCEEIMVTTNADPDKIQDDSNAAAAAATTAGGGGQAAAGVAATTTTPTNDDQNNAMDANDPSEITVPEPTEADFVSLPLGWNEYFDPQVCYVYPCDPPS